MIYSSHASLLTRLACGRGVVFQQPASDPGAVDLQNT
jgi:hypothetical protein